MSLNWIAQYAAIFIYVMMLLHPTEVQATKSAADLFTASITRSVVRLTKIQEIGLVGCQPSGRYDANFSADTFDDELVYATRNGLHKIVINNLTSERVDSLGPRLSYWLAKLRLGGGAVKMKDVTPQESLGTAIAKWIITNYAKDLVASVAGALKASSVYVYGIIADEYISAGIRRYNAIIEYVRAPGEIGEHGAVHEVILTCAR